MSAKWRRGHHALQCWMRQRKGLGGCWCDRLPADRLMSLEAARALEPFAVRPWQRVGRHWL